jgi:putative ABC transport system permease protein
MHIVLRPFVQAHYNQAMGWYHYTDLKNIYQLACLAVVILVIAGLNYILLTLTNALSRSQDVGIRKTIGAGRFQIVLQYYTETQLLSFIAVIVGLLLAVACLPFFKDLTGTNIELSNISYGAIALFLFGLSIVLGLLSGIYPALAMSGLKPLNIMRSFSAYRISPFLSRGMVVVQFTVCVIMVISTLVISRQMHFLNETNMGFNKDLVLKVKSPYSWTDKQKTNVLKNELFHLAAADPAITDMTSASSYFGGGNHNGFIINGQKTMLDALNVDYNYFSLLRIPILKGRAFSRDIATDSLKMSYPDLQKSQKASLALRAVVVNEALYNMLGKPPVGELNNQMGGVIIGVCQDYHTDDLTKKIEPTLSINRSTTVFGLKLRPGKVSRTK